MMRSDVPLCSWNSPAPLAGNTRFISPDLSAKQSGWLQNLWTDAGTCVHCTNTCPRHQPLWPATWSSASLTHRQAYHKTSSTKQLVNGESGYVQAWRHAKWHHFEHLLNWNLLFSEPTLHNRFFSEPPTVYRGKHVFSRHFHRSYLKANKVSKSEGTRKVKYAYHFWKCADGADRKLSINWPMLVETTASQSWRVFWDTMYNLFVC